MRADSILQDKKECYITHRTDGLHVHHIFFGAKNKEISDREGFWVWLRPERHIAMSPYATPHNDRNTDLWLKRECQLEYERTHSREEFIRLIGRSYL